jgi:hypothetical protein
MIFGEEAKQSMAPPLNPVASLPLITQLLIVGELFESHSIAPPRLPELPEMTQSSIIPLLSFSMYMPPPPPLEKFVVILQWLIVKFESRTLNPPPYTAEFPEIVDFMIVSDDDCE